jgi:hypothetical protein
MATQPSLRIGDRERDAVAAELQEHYAHGRLTLEEFNQRLDAVFAAKTQADLSRLTADLPHIRSGGAPLPSSRTGRSRSLASGPPVSGWAGGGWSRSSGHGGNSSGRNPHRGGFATFSSLLAAVASWLLVYHVLLVGVHFAWPGRVGLLVAIFTIIRGLLRRIFRGARRR